MNSLMTHILVKDGQKAYDFYKHNFGFSPVEEMKSDEGKVIWAMFQYKDSSFMMGEKFDFNDVIKAKAPNDSKIESPINLYVTCDNADEEYNKLKLLGIDIIAGLENQYWGHRTFILRDPEGYVWIFGSVINEN